MFEGLMTSSLYPTHWTSCSTTYAKFLYQMLEWDQVSIGTLHFKRHTKNKYHHSVILTWPNFWPWLPADSWGYANSRNAAGHNKALVRNGEIGTTMHQHPNSPRQPSAYGTNQLDKNHRYPFTKSACLLALTHGLGSLPCSRSLSHPINIYI